MDLKFGVLLLVSFCLCNNNDEEESTNTSGNPRTKKTPHGDRACKVQINEIFLDEDSKDTPMQFIELRRFCPPGVNHPVSLKLDGHFMLAIELGTTPKVLMMINLIREERLLEVTEVIDDVEYKSYLHVTGTQNTPDKTVVFEKRNLLRNRKIQYLTHPDLHKILPTVSAAENPIAVLLVYFKRSDRSDSTALMMDYYTDTATNTIKYFDRPMKESTKSLIKQKIIDYVIYGGTTTESATAFMSEVLDDRPFILETINKNSIGFSESLSISRCDDQSKYLVAFEFHAPTPMQSNECQRQTYNPPYKFKGHPIQSDGQKIVINVLHALRNNKNAIREEINAPVRLTSHLVGVGQRSIISIEQKHIAGTIKTPGKIRHRKKWKQEQIDSFDKDVLRSIIADFYKQNLQAKKRNHCIEYTASSSAQAPSCWLPICTRDEGTQREDESTDPTPCSSSNHLSSPVRKKIHLSEDFTISTRTFAKVLKQLGFYYGRIDKRVALLFRQDIVGRRWQYLQALRRNSAKETPLKVTYLDETWIDPNLKSHKGWVLKRPQSLKDRMRYSYRRLKQGHGPRIIVLAAGDDEGIIARSIRVYKVQKNANALDYHENVNREGFINWLKDLFKYWKERNEKHLIVMDNAPYHSTLKTPRQSERKAVLMEWLTKIKNMPSHGIQFELSNRMKKWELWTLIQDLKKRPEIQKEVYEIDAMAAEEGHEVLRLPPYQCDLNPIELTWNDVKRQVAKENQRQDVDETVALARQTLENYSCEKWKNQIKYVNELGKKYLKEDGYMDIEIEPIIIPINDDDEDELLPEDADKHEDPAEMCGAPANSLFDPAELERLWEEDRVDVENFHRNTPYFPGPPPMQPTRLFTEDE